VALVHRSACKLSSPYQKRSFLTYFPLPHQNPPFTPLFLCQNQVRVIITIEPDKISGMG
jgi:hypothetical protein